MPLQNWTEPEYRRYPAANYSTLKLFRSSPQHAKHSRDNPTEPTPAMVLGLAVDCLIFDRTKYHDRFAVAPDVDRRTKQGKAKWAEFVAASSGKTIITEDAASEAMTIACRIAEHHTAGRLLSGKRYQIPITWVDDETGVECKALIDSVIPGTTITDCKTTRDASPHGFARQAAALAYHWQAAMYCDGWKACTGEALPYTFIACENVAPFPVATYRLDDSAIEAGRSQYRAALRTYAECVKSGVWPGYSATLETLELPRWALAHASVMLTEDDTPF